MPGPYAYTLNQVLEASTLPDGITLAPQDSWQDYRELHCGDSGMGQRVTVRLVPERYTGVLTMSLAAQGGTLSLEQARNLHLVLGYANQVADIYEQRHAEERAEQKRKEEERREAYRKEQQARFEAQRKERERLQAALADRKEILLNELVEEEGRIRLHGMKRWRPVKVQVIDRGNGTYMPQFRYRYEKHGYTEQVHARVVAFHVKLHGKFYAVWDEGTDDLRSWEQDGVAKQAKPYAEAAAAGEQVW